MEQSTRFVGLDVHKASIAVAVAGACGDPEDHGQIANDPTVVRKLFDRLGGPNIRLAVAYEAGPTGYALQGLLTALDIECIVVALGQTGHNARYRPNVGSGLCTRQRQVAPAIVEIGRQAQARLHHRYRTLSGRIGRNKAIIAVARELAGLVWAAGEQVTPMAA